MHHEHASECPTGSMPIGSLLHFEAAIGAKAGVRDSTRMSSSALNIRLGAIIRMVSICWTVICMQGCCTAIRPIIAVCVHHSSRPGGQQGAATTNAALSGQHCLPCSLLRCECAARAVCAVCNLHAFRRHRAMCVGWERHATAQAAMGAPPAAQLLLVLLGPRWEWQLSSRTAAAVPAATAMHAAAVVTVTVAVETLHGVG